MTDLNRTMPRVDPSRFSMVPRADIPRSTFITTHSVKSTFNFDDLVPIHVDEVLPGDVHQGQVTVFARLATPVFPIMDSITLETFFFFVPARIAWDNWVKLQGERKNPTDSISYTVPQVVSPAGGFAANSIWDHFGIPVAGQIAGGETISVNALIPRAYALIFDEWFRDENLQNAFNPSTGDGPDAAANYFIQKRNKKHDYFTSCLPWPLKGGAEVSLPLGGLAPVLGIAFANSTDPNNGAPGAAYEVGGAAASGWAGYTTGTGFYFATANSGTSNDGPDIYADLNDATGATINALRLAVQTQRLLERDARSGTRYTEVLKAHFGINPQDARLQRPEYIGGGRTYVQTQAIPQTSATGLTGGTSALGSLGAAAVANDQHSFTFNAPEHGYIIGLVNVTGEVTYQQGLHKMWKRETRYDFYMPVFAFLGEQAVLMHEIYCTGNDANDSQVFGYQERWAEYRHRPSRVAGLFRSTTPLNIDEWHLAEQFGSAPALNDTFIKQNTPTARIFAAGEDANNIEVLFDSVFKIKTTRAMPMFSVPGMMDRF